MNRLKTVFLLIVLSRTGYCYVDPGSGSLVLQAIIAGLLGLSFYIKTIVTYIRGMFSKAGK